MSRTIALFTHVLILLAALRWSYSAGGFLVTGVGLALLLDRHVLRMLPWRPVAWKRELGVRAGSFCFGAAAFALMRPGIVPVWEAAYRGLVVCLAVFLIGLVVDAASRHRGGFHRLFWWGTAVIALALLVPLIAALHPLHTIAKRDPSALGLAFEDIRFRAADGVELAGWLVPHPRSRGNVIFCHGHGRNRGHVAALLPTLHGLGLNVLAFDFRGHGDSDGHTSTFGRREVQDLCAAEAYLRRRFPDQPLLLVGISLGAAVSLQAAPLLPNVRGVWSEGAFARLSDAVEQEFARVPPFLRRPLVNAYYLLGGLDCGFWAPSINPVDRLNDLHVPIFFCHAMQDELVPFSDGRALYEAYPGPKSHWWVEGASHYDVRQRNHQEYLDRLRGFVESCLSRGRSAGS